jgi:DNA invertase Pin-like site-specific DNA recombinase
MNGLFVAYYRLSTSKQGLGLDAQKELVTRYLNGGDWTLAGEFTDIESGKRSDNRPRLQEALTLCRESGATLLIAKLDRLSRNLAFLSALMESEVTFIACDMPIASKVTLQFMAVMAEYEREMISTRTKEGLKAITERVAKDGSYTSKAGNVITHLGTPKPEASDTTKARAARAATADEHARKLAPMIRMMRKGGATLKQIAEELTRTKVETSRGGAWDATTVKRILDRANALNTAKSPSPATSAMSPAT